MAHLHTKLRILIHTGTGKRQERDRLVPTVRKEKMLVRDVLWLEPKGSWSGLGGQWLPENQGQP